MGNKAAMTKTAHHLDLAIADPLGIITLANPPLNFLSVELLGAIADAVEACDADPRVRVIVLRAQGKTFCAGADLVGGAAGKAGQTAWPRSAASMTRRCACFAGASRWSRRSAARRWGPGWAWRCPPISAWATPAARFSANFVALGFIPALPSATLCRA
jgi:enoyl-CoA hydratase/carnithine racemase